MFIFSLSEEINVQSLTKALDNYCMLKNEFLFSISRHNRCTTYYIPDFAVAVMSNDAISWFR
jgi:hypothetical protein